MSDSLRTLLRRYERAQQAADRLSHELASEIRRRIGTKERGSLTRCAEEMGWSRQRLHEWMRRSGRDSPTALTEEARPERSANDSTRTDRGSVE